MKRIRLFVFGVLLSAVSLLCMSATEQFRGSFVAAAQQRGERPAPIYRDDFTVEVLIGGLPQERYPARGKVYVEAVKGVEYELRIRNPLPVRVAVALAVDGLNTIDAKRTTARDGSKWVIPPYGSITVGGWQMSSNRARRFYFTSEPDSYAAKLGRPSDIGVISAVFFREQSRVTEIAPPLPRPDSIERSETERRTAQPSASAESAAKSGSARERAIAPAPDDDYAATGIGRSVGNNVYLVDLNLEPRPIATLNMRYEYRPELVRLGVLPRPYPEPDPLRRRERARGFEDRTFCPEP